MLWIALWTVWIVLTVWIIRYVVTSYNKANIIYRNVKVLSQKRNRKNIGYVYFVTHNHMFHLIKIGKAVNVYNRMRDFLTFAPHGLFLCGYIKCYDVFSVEKYLHRQFQYNHYRGEFFLIDLTLLFFMLRVRKENQKRGEFLNHHLTG